MEILTDMKSRAKKIFLALLFLQVPLLGSCAGNFYDSLGNKTSDEALFKAAKLSVDGGDYSSAITTITTKMTPSYRSSRSVQEFLAGAYAARCGFDFFTLFNSLGNGTALLQILMSSYRTITPVMTDCASADAIMNSFTSLSVDNKVFLTVYGLAEMGMVLRLYEDTNQDGAVDSAANACTTAVISDANLDLVIKGFGFAVNNISSIGSSAPSSITTLNGICGGGCNFTNPGATERTFFRKLIDNQTYGLGSCADNTLATCCPSP